MAGIHPLPQGIDLFAFSLALRLRSTLTGQLPVGIEVFCPLIYKHMFSQGKLKRMGYTMEEEGERLIIKKPSITYELPYVPDPKQLTLSL